VVLNTPKDHQTDAASIPSTFDINEYRHRLSIYIRTIIHDQKVADEVLERVSAHVQNQMRTGAADFWPTARKIVLDQASNTLRKSPFSRPRFPASRTLDGLEKAIEDHVGNHGDNQGRHAMAKSLNELPSEHRRMLRMHYWNGMSRGEVAGWVEKTPEEVTGILGRIKARLAAMMTERLGQARRKKL